MKPDGDGEVKLRDLHILVVDDNQDAALSAAELLRLYGHRVAVAYDGPTALQFVASSVPDIVLLDLAMPKMDGCQVAKALRHRATAKRPLIIAITGYGDQAARQRSREAGIDLHLVKPVDYDELVALLAKLVAASS
jgi:CheY-like chemotaxis protein